MRTKTTRHLDDEHMRLHEWNGTGTCHAPSPGPRRRGAWQASAAALAVLTTLLILNACDSENPVQPADEQVRQAVEQMKAELGVGMLGAESNAPAGVGAEPGH